MIALWLLACGGSAEFGTIEGLGFEWVFFNHRLSYLQADVATATDDRGRSGRFAVVGGTSTTAVPPDLPDTCDPDDCGEFPVHDRANVRLDAAFLVSKGVAAGTGAADLEADADGASGTVTIDLSGAKGTAAVAIAGLTIDTDHLTADAVEHCYDPAFGWHPTRLAVALGEPTLDGDTLTVDVTAHFAAGNSLEDERKCVDEINEQAVAAVRVIVAAIAGKGVTVATQDLEQGAEYTAGDVPFDPDAQPDPDPATRALTLDATDAVLGWTRLDFTFHAGDPDGRGAYIRSLQLDADAATGLASGHANNYSPGTQISGFTYDFTGRAQSIAVPGAAITRSAYLAELPADLDGTGAPIITAFEL